MTRTISTVSVVMLLAVLAVGVAGCAPTKMNQENEQLKAQVGKLSDALAASNKENKRLKEDNAFISSEMSVIKAGGVAKPLAAKGPEVTIKGNVVCNRTTTSVYWDQSSQDSDHYPVMFAFEGTPEISVALDKIMTEVYPEKGLDVDAAQKVLDEFSAHLRFNVAPGPLTDKIHKEVEWGSQILALTGVLSEKDGKKWIDVTKYEETSLNYPPRMIAPDKPLVTEIKDPILLKVDGDLTVKCVYIPAGSFLQGSPFYQQRYQDEFPHEVVLTRGYYMSETPVTQGIYEAIMKANPSPAKGPQCPVESAAWTDVTEFCKILSEKNGMAVRIPTDPEWEYAARVGTSNPCFTAKYKGEISTAGVKESTTPVKSAKPNAWGLYDMLCGGWSVTSTFKVDNARQKEIDPQGPPRGDGSIQSEASGPMHKSRGGYHYTMIRPNMHGAVSETGGLWEGGTQIFRIVVDAAPPATAAPANP